ncbi:hypothetical protein [Singulisphaera sp. PoT]|uniref:hypothetical protein n=1 Tax=Singulisphaera sp. PoT TaxID=3411797 RepID=UPI003BF4671D
MSKHFRSARSPRRLAFQRLESRRLLSNAAMVWYGQDNHDVVGPTASPGPDGLQDIRLGLRNLQPYQIVSVNVSIGSTAKTPANWSYGANPDVVSRAEVVRVVNQDPGSQFPYYMSDTSPNADLYINPPAGITSFSTLTAVITYQHYDSNGHSIITTDTDTLAPGAYSVNPTLATSNPSTANLIPTAGGTAQFAGQYATAQPWDNSVTNAHNAGDVHVYLNTLPSGYNFDSIVSVQLSDVTSGGTQWTYNANGGTNQSLMVKRPASQDAPGVSRVADLYFAPTRDESGSPMTLLITVKDSSGQLRQFYTQFTINSSIDVNLRYPSYDAQAGVIVVSPAGNDLVSYHDPADTSNPFSMTTSTLAQLFAGLTGSGQSIPSNKIHLYDNIRLASGTYTIDASSNAFPLIFSRPMVVTADAGATFQFTMSSVATGQAVAPAIQIQSSHVHISGVSIRFTNPIYWGSQNGLSGAIVGYVPTSANSYENTHPNAMLVDVVLSGIDLQSPVLPYAFATNQVGNIGKDLNLNSTPALGLSSQYLMSFWAVSGTIQNSTFRGGSIAINGGPWTVANNKYVGLVGTDQKFPSNYPNTALANQVIPTYSDALFTSIAPHDQVIVGNTASVVPLVVNGVAQTNGVNYRFLFYSDHTYNNLVSGNTIGQGMGRRVGTGSATPYDSNTLPAPYGNPGNAPELILNENYHVYFEGMATSLSSDRRVLTIPGGSITFSNQTWPISTGDVVSILSGPYAGQFAIVSQVLGSGGTQFLLNTPLPSGSYPISISAGQVNDVYRSNNIDLRGTTSTAFVIQGGSFGTSVINNTIVGDESYVIDGGGWLNTNAAIRIQAMPSETANAGSGFGYPNPLMIPFYYTFNPVFGFNVSGNVIDGTVGGISVSIADSGRSSIGRVYVSGTVSDNQFVNYGSAPTKSINPALETPTNTTLIGVGSYFFRSVSALHDVAGIEYSVGYANLDANGQVVRKNGSLDPAPDGSVNGVPYHYSFADPYAIQLSMSGNSVLVAPGTPVTKYVNVASAIVNGQATVYGQATALAAIAQTTQALVLPAPPPPPPPSSPSAPTAVAQPAAAGALKFDFGQPGSPAQAGFTAISNFSIYSPSIGYGWTAVPRNDMNATNRGSVYATDMTFQVDLPNGYYDVGLVLGDTGPGSTNYIQVNIQGGTVDALWTNNGKQVATTYLAQVVNGHLSIRLYVNTPSDGSIYIDSLVVSPKAMPLQFQFGPNGTTPSPGFDAASNFSHYSAGAGYGWATTSNNMNTQAGMVYATDMTWQVDLPNGYYNVTATLAALVNAADTATVYLQGKSVGTVLTGAGTNPVITAMAQVVDGHLTVRILGAGPDNLAGLKTLTLYPLSFSFGQGGKAAPQGSTAVSDLTTYTTAQGYGFTAVPRNDLKASPNGAVSSTDMTYQVDLPNGYYDVSLVLGDLGGASTNFLHVMLQGGNIDTLWTNSGKLVAQTYFAKVTDGRLVLRLFVDDVSGGAIYLDSLKIAPKAMPLQFQFGPSGETVAPGFDASNNFTYYSAGTGYGFTDSNYMNSQPGMVYAKDMTYQVDLPNGYYSVTTNLAAIGNAADIATIFLQGNQVGVLSTGWGTTPKGTYVVQVTNGHLVLRITGGGPDGLAGIKSLIIANAAAPTTTTTTTTTGSTGTGSGSGGSKGSASASVAVPAGSTAVTTTTTTTPKSGATASTTTTGVPKTGAVVATSAMTTTTATAPPATQAPAASTTVTTTTTVTAPAATVVPAASKAVVATVTPKATAVAATLPNPSASVLRLQRKPQGRLIVTKPAAQASAARARAAQHATLTTPRQATLKRTPISPALGHANLLARHVIGIKHPQA